MTQDPLDAIIVNCTLKASPAPSNTEALAGVVGGHLAAHGTRVDTVRAVDFDIRPGVSSDEGDGDQWPEIRRRILRADILLMATPTWLGQPSSVAKRVMERLNALMSETGEDGRPPAFDKVGGVVVTGNEDGAHHIIAVLAQGMIDIGFTVPAQAWTYWHRGPGPGPDYLDDETGHDWAHRTGATAAANLVAVARALRAMPLPAPAG